MDNPDRTPEKPGAAPGGKSLWQKKRKEILIGSAIALGLVFLGRGLYLLMALDDKPPKDGKDNSAYQSANNSTA